MFKAKAPGSCNLIGEYAVLFNQPMLVCAINRYIEVTLIPRQDDIIHIQSHLGDFTCTRSSIHSTAPFEFVLTAIQSIIILPSGFDLQIKADFSDKLGFASSAAVTVATLAVLSDWMQKPLSTENLVKQARDVIIKVQGLGSGADVAASVYGGLIRYQKDDPIVKSLPLPLDIHLIYSGNKARTKTVVTTLLNNEKLKNQLLDALPNCLKLVQQAENALCQQNWGDLAKACDAYQTLYNKLNANTPMLQALTDHCKQYPSLKATKISGAGFGDCIITLGDLPPNTFPLNTQQQNAGVKQYDLSLAPHGIKTWSDA